MAHNHNLKISKALLKS